GAIVALNFQRWMTSRRLWGFSIIHLRSVAKSEVTLYNGTELRHKKTETRLTQQRSQQTVLVRASTESLWRLCRHKAAVKTDAQNWRLVTLAEQKENYQIPLGW
uniref:Uncharacterized protein n=1 Tax=Parascaris univalens TaxID=6257 RepID=A0A915ARZ4_PARUN